MGTQTIYRFRFKDNLEFGLAGITNWEVKDESYVFYDETGVALVAPIENVICFRLTQEQQEQIDQLVNQMNETLVPPAVQEKILELAKNEAGRFVLMPTADKGPVIVDTETDEMFVVDKDCPTVVEYANRGIAHEKKHGLKLEQFETASIRILVNDVEHASSIALSHEAFNERLQSGELKTVMAPVAQDNQGRQFRIEMSDEGGKLRKCLVTVDSPLGEVQTVERKVPAQ